MSEVVDAAVSEYAADDAAITVTQRDADEIAEIKAAEKKASAEVKMIPLGAIERSEVALRDVDRTTEEYQLLLNSIRKRGIFNSILVREFRLPGGVVKYGLIDGLQRFSCASDAGLQFVPARIVNMDDGELLEAQVITNMNRVQTKPADLSKHLLRIMSRNPLMTKRELAEKTCQSLAWVEQRLSLNKLIPEIQALVNDGRIHLTNAYALSKIPETEQAEHVDAAISESPKTFVQRMKNRVKDIRDAKHAGKDAGEIVFQPTMHMQKVGTVKDELVALESGGQSTVLALAQRQGVSTVEEAVKIALAWVLSFDVESQNAQRAKAEARAQEKKEATERAKAEREKKKEREAAEAAVDITTGF